MCVVATIAVWKVLTTLLGLAGFGCVVAICEKNPLTEEQVDQMYCANSDGAGIAWRETEVNQTTGKEEVYVHWRKGLDVDEMKELALSLPRPYIAHFRIATVGGKRPGLTHPFPVSATASTALTGKTKGYVLFHNGHFGTWQADCKEAAIRSGQKVPTGRWSDTRAMAWLAWVYGPGILEFVNEKTAIMSPTSVEITNGPQWTELASGLIVSNRNWEGRQWRGVTTYHFPNKMCIATGCTNDKVEGKSYCQGCIDKQAASDKKDSKADDKEGDTPSPPTTNSDSRSGGSTPRDTSQCETCGGRSGNHYSPCQQGGAEGARAGEDDPANDGLDLTPHAPPPGSVGDKILRSNREARRRAEALMETGKTVMSSEVPFEVALWLWNLHYPKFSKNQWRKARRAHQEKLNQIARGTKRPVVH